MPSDGEESAEELEQEKDREEIEGDKESEGDEEVEQRRRKEETEDAASNEEESQSDEDNMSSDEEEEIVDGGMMSHPTERPHSFLILEDIKKTKVLHLEERPKSYAFGDLGTGDDPCLTSK